MLEHDCPYYMAIGMTYEQYWYDDPLMARAFYKAEKLRDKRKDEEAWLTGMYFFRAIDATVMNAFRKQGSNPAEYPKEPLTMSLQESEHQEKTAKQEETEVLYAQAYMTNMVLAGKGWSKK